MPISRLLVAAFLLNLSACATKGSAARESDGPSDVDTSDAEAPDREPVSGNPAELDASSEPGSSASDAGVTFGGEAPVLAVAEPDASDESASTEPVVVTTPGVAPSFKRGLNFGNRLDAPNEGEWGPKLRESDFETAAQRGFDHVRLPVRFSAHAENTAPFTVDVDLLTRVDEVIEQAMLQDLSLVLDFQYYDSLMQEPNAHSERFLAIWSQLAERYQELPPHVAFELLSEPNGELGATYNELVAQALEQIRESNPERTVIVDSFDYARVAALPELVLPDDPNVVASVHLYTPEAFTFQGAPWADARFGTTGVVFPGPPATPIVPVQAALDDPDTMAWFDDYNTLPEAENPSGPTPLENAVAALVDFRSETGREVYLGEFGATTLAAEDSRFRFLQLVRSLCEAEDIGWAVWDNNGGDMAVLGTEEGTFLDSTIDALIDP